ncbi:hypothetical protein ACJ72_07301 [Emergomyces africanus]|uniref:Uncharacterized protein n=1 Tax=Emergomyces africanus TaxID=1955775 RepID=A0A1B7NNK3_9EURO|nr:hypothetical protein ACJ72_07301 [Emergomyces africanus]
MYSVPTGQLAAYPASRANLAGQGLRGALTRLLDLIRLLAAADHARQTKPTTTIQHHHHLNKQHQTRCLLLRSTTSLSMSTTTVVGTGLHSSVVSPNWQPKMTMSTTVDNKASPLDKFPLFDDETSASGSPATTDQNNLNSNPPFSHPFSAQSLRYTQPARWPARKQAALSIGSKQRPRKSISEAIGGFRNRGTSVSVNAQELAEALKAPVSYRLIMLSMDFLIPK